MTIPNISALWDAHLVTEAGKRQTTAQAYCRCSSLGEPCLRALFYERTGCERQELTIGTLGIFSMGDECEQAVARRLLDLGYRVECAQMPVSYQYNGSLLFRGSIDGVLVDRDGGRWLFDTKSIDGHLYDGLPEDPAEVAAYLERARQPWLRKYPPQLVSYQMGYEQPCVAQKLDGSMLIFRNKSNGRIKVGNVDATDARRQWVIDRCTTVNRYIKDDEVPGYCAEPELCARCRYLDVTCDPVLVQSGIHIVDVDDPANSEIIASLTRYLTLRDSAKLCKAAEETAKDRFRRMPAGTYAVPGIASVTVSAPNKIGSITVKINDEGDANA